MPLPFYPGFIIKIIMGVGPSLSNTLISLQLLQSLAFGFGTFAYAKDRASSPLDGLFRGGSIARSVHEQLPRHLAIDMFGFILKSRKYKMQYYA